MNAFLVYPHQLFEESLIFKKINKKEDIVFLIEDDLYFTQYDFHEIKIEFHKKTMNFYKKFLEDKKYTVKIIKDLNKLPGVKKVFVYDVVDDYLERKIKKSIKKLNIDLEILETPMFLTSNIEIEEYVELHKTHKKIFFMKNFYNWQRKRMNILMRENGKPIGGKWSFDEDNRQKISKDIQIPKEYKLKNNFIYATDFSEAKKCLQYFLKEKLNNFGPYEDAVIQDENFLFHSVLSPYLNVGLLTPEFVIKETIKYYKANSNAVALQSLEGFIRQIIGWREYMRMVYIKLGGKIRSQNYFSAKRKVPQSFWTGNTGILPIDNSISKINKTAYDHHIPRLMLLGNFMNLCGFDPNDVYRWFMERFIDAYDWVMVANVYSMALYADGGMITTKPYISGSSYILKMSDFKKGKIDDKNSWDKIWDALFWNFVDMHFDKLSKEGRLGFIGVTYNKMSQDKKDHYKKVAKNFLDSI